MAIKAEKACSECGEILPAEQFYVVTDKQYGHQYLSGPCKGCARKRTKRWRVENRERFNERARVYRHKTGRRQDLRKYGVTPEWYEQTLVEQGGVCAICKRSESCALHGAPRRLAVDHDAVTGTVRGLLCFACNTAIGHFDHDVSLLTSAVGYLNSTG